MVSIATFAYFISNNENKSPSFYFSKQLLVLN